MAEQEKKIGEADIEEYGRRFRERRERTEGVAEKEAREHLAEMVQEDLQSLSSVPPGQALPTDEPPIAFHDDVSEIRALPEDDRLHALIDVAFTKGIKQSIALVWRMRDPYLTDAFHDAIVNALYEELVKRGIITPPA